MGRLVFEGVDLKLRPAGKNRITRIRNAVLPATCQGYAAATPTFVPSEGAVDGLEAIDLQDMPSEWWALTNATGGNIRLSDANNNFIPFDLFFFDQENEQGGIVLRRRLPKTPEPVRVWVCDQSYALFPPGSLFGQYNTYPPWIIAIWPHLNGPSRTNTTWTSLPAGDPSDLAARNPFDGDTMPSDGVAQPDDCSEARNVDRISALVSVQDAEAGVSVFFGMEERESCDGDPASASLVIGAYPNGTMSPTEFGYARSGGSAGTIVTGATPIAADTLFRCYLQLNAVGSFTVDVNGSNAVTGGGMPSSTKMTVIYWAGLPSAISESAADETLTGDSEADPGLVNATVIGGVLGRPDGWQQAAMDHFMDVFNDQLPGGNDAYWDSWAWQSSPDTLVGGV